MKVLFEVIKIVSVAIGSYLFGFISAIAIGKFYEDEPEVYHFETPTDRCEHCKRCREIRHYVYSSDSVLCGNELIISIPDRCPRFKPSNKKDVIIERSN